MSLMEKMDELIARLEAGDVDFLNPLDLNFVEWRKQKISHRVFEVGFELETFAVAKMNSQIVQSNFHKETKKFNKKEYQQITIHTVTSDDIKFAA